MPVAALLPSIAVAVALATMAWLAMATIQPARARSLANLNRGLNASPSSSAGKVEATSLERIARGLTPGPMFALLERQHARAGRPRAWPVERLLTLKLLWAPVAIISLTLLGASRAAPFLIVLAVLVVVGVFFLPELLLVSRGQERDANIQLELADTLDQMTIAVEAGLGFDAALMRVASNGSGSLSEELTRTLQDMRMGVSRAQAFRELGERNNVDDLRTFIRAVLQADAFGISIGDVLRTQAAEMRLKRRQRAEAKAQQVPVKVIFPLMLCILPVLFIVILAPAVLGLMSSFSGSGL